MTLQGYRVAVTDSIPSHPAGLARFIFLLFLSRSCIQNSYPQPIGLWPFKRPGLGSLGVVFITPLGSQAVSLGQLEDPADTVSLSPVRWWAGSSSVYRVPPISHRPVKCRFRTLLVLLEGEPGPRNYAPVSNQAPFFPPPLQPWDRAIQRLLPTDMR